MDIVEIEVIRKSFIFVIIMESLLDVRLYSGMIQNDFEYYLLVYNDTLFVRFAYYFLEVTRYI